jgi:UTP--glucose-1-phosphate uridylyltransferase
MLPIVDKPTIQYIVEEAAASGIKDIMIISGRNKRSIEDHFDKSFELESILMEKDQMELLDEIQKISSLVNIYYIRQKEAKGLGDAILCARSFIGNEPFAVLLGDIILQSNKPAIGQLIELYEESGAQVIGVQVVEKKEVNKYGIIDPLTPIHSNRTVEIKGLIEKPEPHHAPSNLAILGRYVLTPSIFKALEKTEAGAGGEIQLTDAIQIVNEHKRVLACRIDDKVYDIGSKFGFVKATIDFAIERKDLRDGVIEYLKEILEKVGKEG